MNKVIEIVITPTGETKLATRGFVGDACRTASRFLELALGETIKEQLTGEFHQPQVSEIGVQSQQ